MSLQSGTHLGAFEITGMIGAGGMGEVYRARDTKLGRDVAVKVLPADLASDPERLARFEREAKLLATLDHPNIGALHDFQYDHDTHFLVMQLLEGETLADRISRGPLALKEMLPIFVQIAEGLEYAHEKGIVHRDLKPANIKIGDDDRVKLIDFGIAKSYEHQDAQLTPAPRPSSSDATTLPATSTPPLSLTGEDMLIGTPAYMSPEQAKGRPVDKRTDIWAFGCCLIEALTGRHPFRGDSIAETISKVIKDEPDLAVLPKSTPASVRTLIGRCLEKDPKRRLRDIGEAWFILNETMSGGTSDVAPAQPERSLARIRTLLLAIVAALVILVVAIFLSTNVFGPSTIQRARPNYVIAPVTSLVGVEYSATWSPDGNFVAYDGTAGGSMDIYVQSVAGDEPRLLVGDPADDFTPRWSPDGRYIAFLSGRDEASSVYLIPALGGSPRRIAASNLPPLLGIYYVLGASPWSPDSRQLLFARFDAAGKSHILTVDIESGNETQITFPEDEGSDISAAWSHNGEWIVFNRVRSRRGSLWIMPAQGGNPRPLLVDDHDNRTPAWSNDDKRIVFVSDRAGSLNIWELDIDSPEDLSPITAGPGTDRFPAVSADGRIAYSRSKHLTDLYTTSLEDRAVKQLTFDTHDNFGARHSPNGKEIAFHSPKSGNQDLWVYSRASGTARQLTFSPHDDLYPDWSPDGRKIVFISRRSGTYELWVIDALGGTPRILTDIGINMTWATPYNITAGGPRWSPDGKAIGILGPAETGNALWVVDVQSETVDTTLVELKHFVWFLDSRRIIYSPSPGGDRNADEIRVANLATGEDKVLFEEPHGEIAVARDGCAISYLRSESHFNLNLYMLRLSPPDSSDGLPSTVGDPIQITDGQGMFHIHNGDFSPNGKEVVYTRDTDEGNIYVIDPVP